MGRPGRFRRAAVGLPVLLGALALSSCGSAAQSFQLTGIDHADVVPLNGGPFPITFHWTGDATFPVTVQARNGPQCDATCTAGAYSFDRATTPLVWPGATFCNGNPAASSSPEPFDAYLRLVDAAGHRTQEIYIKSLCYPTPVAVHFESVVIAQLGPAIPSALRAPNQVPLGAADILRSLALAAGMLLLIAFPAQLFNSTMQSHYDEVMGWFEPVRRLGRVLTRRTAPPGQAPQSTPGWAIAAVLAGASLLSAVLDPAFGANVTTAETIVGALLGLCVTTFLYSWVQAAHAYRITGERGRFHVYRGGIAIAVFCVLLSRITGAQPGYMYGVMLAYTVAATRTLPRHHRGRMTAVVFGAILLTSIAVWIAWIPVKSAATAHTVFPLVALSSGMSTIFLAGMTSLVFSLMPLRFLDGEHLWAWRRGVWLALFGAGMFLFVHVVLDAASTAVSPQRSYAVAIGMFTGFGVLSTAFWAYFRFRPQRLGAAPRATPART